MTYLLDTNVLSETRKRQPAAEVATWISATPPERLHVSVLTLGEFEQGISQQLLFARLAEFFGALAVVLVATGLYGTLAYRVNRRTVEIGVRMAVGAQRSLVVWWVLRDSLVLPGVGVVLGVPLAMLVARALGSALYGVQPSDVGNLALAGVGVGLVALVASAVPARRAASVDPLRALRTE